jgi:hypothetical protein
VYVFESADSGAHWTQTAQLFASDYLSVLSDFYGSTYGGVVEVYDHTIAVGDEEDNFIVANEKKVLKKSGSVYMYERVEGAWTEQAHLVSPYQQEYEYFGTSVALDSSDGNLVVVGTQTNRKYCP